METSGWPAVAVLWWSTIGRQGLPCLLDQLISGGGAVVKQVRAPRVPRGEIAERARAFVLVLDALATRVPAGGGQRRVLALAGLDRRFSSAQTTSSPGCSRSPCQRPAQRSRIGPAFSANRGSREKIHERRCHGLIASSDSHRQTVTPLICSTIPRPIA